MWDVRSLLPDDGAIWYGTEGPEPRQIFWVTDRGDALTSYASSRFWAAEMLLGDAGSLHVLGGSGSGGWIETLDIETGTLTRLGYAPRSSSTLRCVGGALWWRTPSAVFTLPVDGSAGPRAVAVGLDLEYPLAVLVVGHVGLNGLPGGLEGAGARADSVGAGPA